MCADALVAPIKDYFTYIDIDISSAPSKNIRTASIVDRSDQTKIVVCVISVCIRCRNRAANASCSQSTLTLPVPLDRCCIFDDRHSHLVHACRQHEGRRERSIDQQEVSLFNSKRLQVFDESMNSAGRIVPPFHSLYRDVMRRVFHKQARFEGGGVGLCTRAMGATSSHTDDGAS